MIRSILKISLFIPLLFSCQYEIKTIDISDCPISKKSYLTELIKVIESTETYKWIPFSYPLRFYPLPIGCQYDLGTFDKDLLLANKEIYLQLFDYWVSRDSMVKKAYEGDISYYDQVVNIRNMLGVSSSYCTTFWKSSNYEDIDRNEFVEAWLLQLNGAKMLYYLLALLIILLIPCVKMDFIPLFVFILIFIIFFWGGVFVLFKGYISETDKSSLNLAKVTDQIIEVIQSSSE
jgi:hypothetical protein